MARYSAGVRATAGTVLRPMMSIYSPAATVGSLVELGCFNTTAVALEVFLTRLTATGTQGAGLTEARHKPKKPPALVTAFTTHTADATLGTIWVIGRSLVPPLDRVLSGRSGMAVSTLESRMPSKLSQTASGLFLQLAPGRYAKSGWFGMNNE